MTLILGMSKPEGIYMCVDYRVTDLRTGAIVDDAAAKCLTVHYPPLGGGTKALFAFTGIANLPDGTPTLTWLRETIRGESEVPDQSLTHLNARLNRDYGGLRRLLIINVLALHQPDGRRFFGGFSNVRASALGSPMPSFGYTMREVNTSFLFGNGSGAVKAMADEKLAKMSSLLEVKPRQVTDHMKLLSIVNRRVAARDSRVSPYCKVSFINAADRFSPTARAFVDRGESVPFDMPFILAGIDLTDMTRQVMDSAQAAREGSESPPPLDPVLINEHLRRRP